MLLSPTDPRPGLRVLAVCALCVCGPACAQPALALPADALRAYLSSRTAALAGAGALSRVEVELAPTAPRAGLAPCAKAEPSMPAGAPVWGRVSVAVRCVEGANWTVFVPATVRAWGPALVSRVALPAGVAPRPDEVGVEDIELSREPSSVLRDPAELHVRLLARPVAAGAVLRQDMLRLAVAVQAGDMVRLRIAGPGFTVMGAGQALGSAAPGQAVRVRTELGKVVTGAARDGRMVDLPW